MSVERIGPKHWLAAASLGLGALAIFACPEARVDRRGEVLAGVVEGQLLPDLAASVERAEALEASVAALCSSPDAAGLDAAQAAWMQLRAPWKRLLAVALGPVVDDGVELAIDFWPIRTDNVEAGVAAGITSPADLDALGVSSKGMPAIEYLLWDSVGGDAAVLAALPDRCPYVELLAGDVALRLRALEQAWTEGFADELSGAAPSEMLPDRAAAIDALVNAMIAGLHDVERMKLGKPLGFESGIGPDPELLESRFSDRSLLDARDALVGFERAYLGADAEHVGLTVLVADASPDIDAELRAAIDAATQALAAVPEPLREALLDNPAAVADAEAAINELRLLMTADVASLLGVTVSLSDNDGD